MNESQFHCSFSLRKTQLGQEGKKKESEVKTNTKKKHRAVSSKAAY
jgi:hypothetical protein